MQLKSDIAERSRLASTGKTSLLHSALALQQGLLWLMYYLDDDPTKDRVGPTLMTPRHT